MTQVAFVGMTHLGLISASAVAAKGFQTLCYDPKQALVTRLRDQELPVSEPGLKDLIASNVGRQTFSADADDLHTADLVYIAPDVPTDDQGMSDLSYIEALIEAVLPHFNANAVLVVLCQVPPGFTRTINWPSDQLCYQVETLVFGRAVERATQPERYIVGLADPSAAIPRPLANVLQAYGCPILPMRYESAELAKISINMCLVASISVANTMSELCEHIGADWSQIAPALKLDERIGPSSYLSPGLGIAGGNLERDLATVVRLGAVHGTDTGVVAAQITNSSLRKMWAAETIKRLGLHKARIGVWGLAYKEDTHSVKNSPAIATLSALPDASIIAHDPAVVSNDVELPLTRVKEPLDALVDADVLLILTPWSEYRQQDTEQIAALMAGKIVIDPYSVLDRQAVLSAGMHHHTLGVGEEHA